jgi:hypothetical protein
MEYGLAGIAVGINHWVKQKFVRGDIHEILEEIIAIFLNYWFFWKKKNRIIRYQYYFKYYIIYTYVIEH